MSIALNELLSVALRENGYDFPASVQQQFIHYLALLQKWNRVFNLTAIDAPCDMIYLHILDGLSLSPFLYGKRMLDVGSGGGVPGIPLAIMDPEKTWVLLDKSQKKTRFLIQAVAELQLKNITVVCDRCENFHPEIGFDSIVSRAFGTITLFLESTRHLLCPEGRFLAMKGSYPQQEIAEISSEFKVLETRKLTIQGLPALRHVVTVMRNVT